VSPTLTILGGGGWVPAHGRHTACALLRDGEHGILIDAGTGAARLLERPELLDGITRLDIVLTHFHLDHISGLAYLPAVGHCEQTTLWGPGRLLYDTTTSELIGRISNEPFHPVPLDAQNIEIRDLPPGEVELAGVRLALRRQGRHSAPTLGLRFDDRLAWLTDTAFDPDSARFAGGCHTLAHEAWFPSAAPRNPKIHSSAAQAAQVALDAGAERLLLIHLPPFASDLEALLHDAAGAGRADATLAGDGLRLTPTG
jgi:ribonuclease BN (tRNA processing enzyme)